MLKRLADLLTFALDITRRTDEHDRRITSLEAEVGRLSHPVSLLVAEMQHARQHEQDEREKQALRFQLTLERLERRLISPPSSGDIHS